MQVALYFLLTKKAPSEVHTYSAKADAKIYSDSEHTADEQQQEHDGIVREMLLVSLWNKARSKTLTTFLVLVAL